MEWIPSLILAVLLAALFWRYRNTQTQLEQTKYRLQVLNHNIAADNARLVRLLAYHDVLNNLCAEALIQVNTDLQILNANIHAISIFGELEAEATLIWWTKRHQLVDVAQQAFQTQLDITQQFNYKNHVYELKVAPVHVYEQVVGAVFLLRDVSELQRLGRARRDFVANISHDLRTPITNIRLLAETLLIGDLDDTQRAQNLTQKILGETDVLEQINQELMDLSMIESGRVPLKLLPINLARLVHNQLERLRPRALSKGLKLDLVVPPDLMVLVDEAFMGRVLTNLIHNAIKFTPQGKVTVYAELDPVQDMVLVSVQDTGVGISSEELHRVFERFYKNDAARSRERGIGLGLAIARHIVEAHGGKIWANSTPGQGATFYLTLPPG